jgi:geranylgeranyl pyrophosphate synthase
MKTQSAAESLQERRRAVDRELERLLEGESRLFEALRYAVLSGGKRFRPLLLLAAGEAFGGSPESLIPYACALELIHDYSLVHDDLPCMDNDDVRRGRPSCHKAFGDGLALLAGDALLTMAFETLANASAEAVGPARKEYAVREIARAAGVRGMIGGQWLDIGRPAPEIDGSVYDELIAKKTGALILAAARAGAVLGSADARGLAAMERYGNGIGRAFQLRDDLLDSKDDGKNGGPVRPNAVAVFGLEGTKNRLFESVDRALQALREVSLHPDELRELAEGLLRFDKDGAHG